MAHTTRGVYQDKHTGLWQVDKYKRGTRFRERGFESADEAERWLVTQLHAQREQVVHGQRATYTFNQAAAYFVQTSAGKTSLETDIYMLASVMPFIGDLALSQVHDGVLTPFVQARLKAGRAHKTINLALGVVRHVLNLAANKWRDAQGKSWLEHAPTLTMLPLAGYQRDPQPISWGEQRTLLPLLPGHLGRMALFTLNTGVRDDVVCNLRWAWEIEVPELGVSVFEVPRAHVKGKRASRLVVCNAVAQSVVESVRGQHPEFVFVYRRERVKNFALKPSMPYAPIGSMNNTAWQTARTKAKLGDLHVHDLRHTVGMRLREMGVAEGTISDILWHAKKTMTQHYSVAQIVELHGALEKIKDSAGRWNKSLATLKAEQAERQAAQAEQGNLPMVSMGQDGDARGDLPLLPMGRVKSPPKVPQIGPQKRVA